MKKAGFVLLAVAVCLAAAIFWLDFRIMNSQSHQQSSVATSGKENFLKQAAFSPMTTALYVGGEGPVSAALREQLQEVVRGQPYTGDVTMLNLPADRLDLPALFVEVTPVSYRWTPIHATSEFRLVVSYATNGDVSFHKMAVSRFQSDPERPALQFAATFTLSDDSWGVISAPGYSNYLAGQFAQLIQETLRKQLTG